MIFSIKRKSSGLPKKAFDLPLKHRFTFVPDGWTYYEGFVVQISEKVSTQKKAFFIASEVFQRDHAEKAKKGVAVFYGNVESPDCKDTLYGAYNTFGKRKRK